MKSFLTTLNILLVLSFSFNVSAQEVPWWWQPIQRGLDLIDSFNNPTRNTCPVDSSLNVSSEEGNWERAGFGNTSVRSVNTTEWYADNRTSFTHEFDLSIINLRESGWSDTQIDERIRMAASVFAQCGVRINQVEVITGDSPCGHADIRNDNNPGRRDRSNGGTIHLSSITPTVMGARLYFVRSLSNGSYGTSRRSELFAGEPDLNTTWVSSEDLEIDDLLTTAHELAHVLANTGHVSGDERNLLHTSFDMASEDLNSNQCEDIRNGGMVREI